MERDPYATDPFSCRAASSQSPNLPRFHRIPKAAFQYVLLGPLPTVSWVRNCGYPVWLTGGGGNVGVGAGAGVGAAGGGGGGAALDEPPAGTSVARLSADPPPQAVNTPREPKAVKALFTKARRSRSTFSLGVVGSFVYGDVSENSSYAP